MSADPRVRALLDAAEAVVAVLAQKARDAGAGDQDWQADVVVMLHLVAAFEASQSTESNMSREQYVRLVRAHADTLARLN